METSPWKETIICKTPFNFLYLNRDQFDTILSIEIKIQIYLNQKKNFSFLFKYFFFIFFFALNMHFFNRIV